MNQVKSENEVNESNPDVMVKAMLSIMLNGIRDYPLQQLLRFIIFTLCGEFINWQKVYNKMVELMPELKTKESQNES